MHSITRFPARPLFTKLQRRNFRLFLHLRHCCDHVFDAASAFDPEPVPASSGASKLGSDVVSGLALKHARHSQHFTEQLPVWEVEIYQIYDIYGVRALVQILNYCRWVNPYITLEQIMQLTRWSEQLLTASSLSEVLKITP